MTTRIAFKDVSVSFDQLKVVESVSFDVADREFVSIIGPSGCGKTTMMNIVAGFVQPTTGTVLLDDKPIEGPGPERGVIFQEYGVFPWWTVSQNIEFGLNLDRNGALLLKQSIGEGLPFKDSRPGADIVRVRERLVHSVNRYG
mgnify:CR=1 FL=1